jgi:hypothetical protein
MVFRRRARYSSFSETNGRKYAARRRGHDGEWSMKSATIVRMIAVSSLAATIGGCMLPGSAGGGGPLFSVMFITREPPPERVEIVSVRPSGEAVWISGHWTPRGDDYAWTSGRWERPRSDKKEWENGKWEHEKRGWFYTEGHWR